MSEAHRQNIPFEPQKMGIEEHRALHRRSKADLDAKISRTVGFGTKLLKPIIARLNPVPDRDVFSAYRGSIEVPMYSHTFQIEVLKELLKEPSFSSRTKKMEMEKLILQMESKKDMPS